MFDTLQHAATLCNTLQPQLLGRTHPCLSHAAATLQPQLFGRTHRCLSHAAATLQPQLFGRVNSVGCILVVIRTATHYNMLQHAATRSNTQQHTATHCNTM